jgi:hypothetical protein
LLKKELTVRGVKIAPLEPMKSGIDSAMCLLLLLVEKVFLDSKVQAVLRYVRSIKDPKKRIPIVLIQDVVDVDAQDIIGSAPSEIRNMFANTDEPIMLRQIYPHEKAVFVRQLSSKIEDTYLQRMELESTSSYLVFLSHFKVEAGAAARVVHDRFEAQCNVRQAEDPKLLKNAKAFLDSDNLTDLEMLPEGVRKSKVLIVMLTKRYFTRPWCLAELFIALEAGIKIITVKVTGGGYDFEEGVKFLSTLTPEVLDDATPIASTLPSILLRGLGVNVTELGSRLATAIPKIIMINFNPNESGRKITATIDEMIDHILGKSIS